MACKLVALALAFVAIVGLVSAQQTPESTPLTSPAPKSYSPAATPTTSPSAPTTPAAAPKTSDAPSSSAPATVPVSPASSPSEEVVEDGPAASPEEDLALSPTDGPAPVEGPPADAEGNGAATLKLSAAAGAVAVVAAFFN